MKYLYVLASVFFFAVKPAPAATTSSRMSVIENAVNNPFNGECSCVGSPGNYPGVVLFRKARIWGEEADRTIPLFAFPREVAPFERCEELKTSLEKLGVCEVK